MILLLLTDAKIKTVSFGDMFVMWHIRMDTHRTFTLSLKMTGVFITHTLTQAHKHTHTHALEVQWNMYEMWNMYSCLKIKWAMTSYTSTRIKYLFMVRIFEKVLGWFQALHPTACGSAQLQCSFNRNDLQCEHSINPKHPSIHTDPLTSVASPESCPLWLSFAPSQAIVL